MAILIDSADLAEARAAFALGFVRGATTNPALMARVADPAEQVIRQLCTLTPGPVFYQVTAAAVADREAEARRVRAISAQVVIKIPATTENMSLIVRLAAEGIPCAATAVFSVHQTYVACIAGARYVIPYVNRTTRLLGDGPALVREMRAVIAAGDRPVEIVAASIKSAEEAVAAVLAGAHHLTLPLAVIRMLGEHSRSQEAIAKFAGRDRR